MPKLFGFLNKREVGAGLQTGTTTTDGTSQQQQQQQPNGGGSFVENIAYVTSEERAERIATWHRCTGLIANTLAQLLPKYQRYDREKQYYKDCNLGYFKTLNYLLQVEPNPTTTAFEMWQQAALSIINQGNAFILIKRDRYGNPKEFWLAEQGSYNEIEETYTLTMPFNDEGWATVAKASDVIHLPNTFRRRGSRLGISTLEHARNTLTLSATLDSDALETAAKGGRMKMMISEERQSGQPGTIAYGNFDKRQAENYAREVNQRIYQQDVVALRGLDKVQQISMSAADMQLFEQRQFTVPEICRLLDVPRSLAMDGSNSSYKTPEADRIDFLVNAVQPRRTMWQAELRRKLLTFDDFDKARIFLDPIQLVLLDAKGQAETNQLRLITGQATVNELRHEANMPAVENGDVPYITTNVAELGSKKLSGEESANKQQPAQQQNKQ